MSDLLTVLWKERRDLAGGRGGTRGLVTMLVFVGIAGVLVPLQLGAGFVRSPLAVVVPLWAPLSLCAMLAADQVAGERERHTLETLLASRLADHTILLGKVIATTLYGFGVSMLCMVVALIAANLAHGHGHLLLYSPLIAVATPLLSLLATLCMVTLSILISMRSPTVRQAGQTVGIVSVAPFLLFMVLPLLPKPWLSQIVDVVQELGLAGGVAVCGGILAVAAAVMLGMAAARFRRPRLIL